MTTIACNLECMAADSRVTWNDLDNQRINTAYGSKLERIGNILLATSGDFASGIRFHEYMRANEKGKKPKLTKDFRALKLCKEGIFLIDGSDLTWMPVGPRFYSIGSGAPYAIGALEMGATPERAVTIAKEYDVYTGGSVTVMMLNSGDNPGPS